MASDDEYSDLTELESNDDYGDSITKKHKKATHTGWRIRNALKVPRATTYTSQALYDQIYGGDINLEPEYQRDVVWSEIKQIGIIDSVFRNFYIPPVIFAVNVQEDGSETKTCIDGKQRLTSIYKFMEGLIPRKSLVHLPYKPSLIKYKSLDKDPITGEKLWYKDAAGAGGPKRKPLPEKYRRLFANKQIVCVEYQDITDADEREIFQRVQLGMALTPAEKLQVVKTPRSDFVRELQNKYAKDDGWLGPNKLGWDVSRGSDYRGIAQAVYCMVTYANLSGGLTGMSQLEKWLVNDEPLPPSKRESVEEAFQLFADMVKDKKLNKELQSPTKLSPVEFIFVAVFIFAHKMNATLSQLVSGIADMRQYVRKQHVDVRMNTRVSKTMVDFIKKWGSKGSHEITGLVNKRKRVGKKAMDANAGDNDGGEDVMDVDDDEDDAAYTLKAKKKNTGPSGNTEASTSKTTPPVQVKNEHVMSPSIFATLTPPASAPMADRMAAMKLAKAKVAQAQADRTRLPLSAPRSLRPETTYDSLVLPSPMPSHGLPSSLSAAPHHVPPSLASSSQHPPPPSSGASDGSFRYGDRDNQDSRYASRGQDGRGPSHRAYR